MVSTGKNQSSYNWNKMMSLRPILKVRNKIKEKSKQKIANLDKIDITTSNNEVVDDGSFEEELRTEGQFLE